MATFTSAIQVRSHLISVAVALLLLCVLVSVPAWATTIEFTDDLGQRVSFAEPPQRVVSLVPSITEVMFGLGAGEHLQGLTLHSTMPAEVHDKEIVGSFFCPCMERIKALNPDTIMASTLHDAVRKAFAGSEVQVVTLKTESIADSFEDIHLLGRIFGEEAQARSIVEGIQAQLDLIQDKVARIPESKRKRVIRLMGRDRVMTPGQDSFQSELIRLAGGIPPELGKDGEIVPVTREEWQDFDPQVIYGCGGDREVAEKYFSRPGWKDVQALQDGALFWFPCALTCRVATHSGDFVAWLASRVYAREFAGQENLVREEGIVSSRSLHLDLEYVRTAGIATSRIQDFENKSLVVEFKAPMSVVSTLEGQRSGVRTVGNHYSPPPSWSLGHHKGLDWVRSQVYEVIGVEPEQSSFLFTGADMDNLAVQTRSFKDMAVTALVTAGVRSNAVRMSRDEGRFYEPGTINIILLPNMALSPRAMTRAVISATEAKTAALLDMDIRSVSTPLEHRATGTGTDNILVAEGTGTRLDNAGGHSKLGELIANAVYAGVQEAVQKQNGLVAQRSVFHRLQERRIGLYDLVSNLEPAKGISRQEVLTTLNCVLLQPKYADFLQAAITLSDDVHKGLLTDMSAYRSWCREMAADIAGRPIQELKDVTGRHDWPRVLAMALNAILNGVVQKETEARGQGTADRKTGLEGAFGADIACQKGCAR